MSPLLHRLRSKSSFHTTSSSSSSSHSNAQTPDSSPEPKKKFFGHKRNALNSISVLVETEVVTECYRCGPGKGHSHGEQCFNDDVILIERSPVNKSTGYNDRRNAVNLNPRFESPLPAKSLRNTASHSYLQGKTGRRPSGSPLKNHHRGFDPVIEAEYQKLVESRARLESEVKQQTEYLHHLQGRRGEIVEEGTNIRRSVTPETELKQDRMQFVNPLVFSFRITMLIIHPQTPRQSESSPSSARRACQDAYAKMTPTRRHLMKDKLHWDGLRRRNLKREKEEQLDWERYQQNSPRRATKSTYNEKKENKRVQELQDDIQSLEKILPTENPQSPSESWELYENSWKQLNNIRSSSIIPDRSVPELTFNLIPWPISDIFIPLPDSNSKPTIDGLFDTIFSTETISTFLFSAHHSEQKSKRQRLHDALLHYHPDRFENHILCFVVEKDRTVTKLAMSRVARVLNSMLSDC